MMLTRARRREGQTPRFVVVHSYVTSGTACAEEVKVATDTVNAIRIVFMTFMMLLRVLNVNWQSVRVTPFVRIGI